MRKCSTPSLIIALACFVGCASQSGDGSGKTDNGDDGDKAGQTVQATTTDKTPENAETGQAAGAARVQPQPVEPDPAAQKPVPAGPPPREVSFQAADDTEVFGDLYQAEKGKARPMILLFHQAGSNAGEYETIGPHLRAMGYNALAIDARSGGNRWKRLNRTMKTRNRRTTGYLEAYPDLAAAVDWASREKYQSIAVWGSSYSAALVFKLAAEYKDTIAAVLAFSPGEYINEKGTVAGWAKNVTAPVYITSATGKEVARARAIYDALASKDKVQYDPPQGVHGASTLILEKNREGRQANWDAVEKFLRRVLK